VVVVQGFVTCMCANIIKRIILQFSGINALGDIFGSLNYNQIGIYSCSLLLILTTLIECFAKIFIGFLNSKLANNILSYTGFGYGIGELIYIAIKIILSDAPIGFAELYGFTGERLLLVLFHHYSFLLLYEGLKKRKILIFLVVYLIQYSADILALIYQINRNLICVYFAYLIIIALLIYSLAKKKKRSFV
jgi:hypothetical protein